MEQNEEYRDKEEAIIEVASREDVTLPHYASNGAAGADVRAYLQEAQVIEPGGVALIPTGLYCAIPEGFEIQIRPRSGLALKSKIAVLNTPGTIDCDYRGEIRVILINHGKEPFTVEPGMRIAQLVVAPVVRGLFVRCQELSQTQRGAGSFGSTGVK